ncbi:hypothetical protein COT78_01895 [Candidatus Berkelbacteria bacterium CG10_big_fil_rev_8_21_14_0_10_43_13]|uniref:Transposase IS200-like domain-containing protein n=1 Tax=Candidatus Berkelbacteria bacterium CG10_big_fil_rev_8_21_14_0_10_43_13 TaxID=1974514 RepID=A0A2H0W6H6_9BACT|nr:MAG: hypothetical protein COT78_01895 [Candidatus Berkelbacteria bacterium CG10_big_fil_rev_8_21_14_0_10_43_13]
MPTRKQQLHSSSYYHLYNRSIAGYKIFNDAIDYERFYDLLRFCRFSNFTHKLSDFLDLSLEFQIDVELDLKHQNNKLVEIYAYCLMPTHFHILLRQSEDGGITKFMHRTLNSYSKYFNARIKRSGPLWTGPFKNVLVQSDEQLLHLTRYIHLNPTSAGLIIDPSDWSYSSYKYFIDPKNNKPDYISPHDELFKMSPSQYKKFTLDQKDFQRNLSHIKSLLIENYSG